MTATSYDYIVIGKGLMGAAAARHLAAASQSVALIGPDEPAQPTTHEGIFGSHFKIGGYPQEHTLGSLEALQSWFRGQGSTDAARHLEANLHRVVPGLRPVAMHSDACVTTTTPTGQIYADRIGDGRLGALIMAHDAWTYDIDAHHFRARFAAAASWHERH